MTRPSRSVSSLTKARNAAGELATTSAPCSAILVFTTGSARIATLAWCKVSMIAGGLAAKAGLFKVETGEKVLEENFRDFKEFDQRNYDELLGLFENLRSLETQLVGIFVPQETSATRFVFTE